MNQEEIKLRAVEPEDVDFILVCESDRNAAKWSDYRAPFSRTMLMSYALTYDADPFSSGQLRLVAETPDRQRVGIVDLYDISEKDSKGYVGICIHPDQRGKGLGLKSLEALKTLASERLGLYRLVAKISSENPAALSMFKKAGFQSLALLPGWHKIGRSLHDFYLMECLI